jgi:outer membrane protein assembly factor BamD
MSRRIPVIFLVGMLALSVACTNKKVNNPLANVGSKQPDKVLYDRAMDAMKHNRFDVARLTLQTLINTYPDSEFVARAKLSVADSWYAEGGSTALAQAEIEYNDFKTFFPNMPEAAEAQLKIANIHYQQMEKPDRDFTHAMRAEEEYRAMILQFPDSKLLPEAKKRLMQVQEVIAEREFRVGKFYFMRQSFPAAIARLRSLTDRYPLYSGADQALYLLGQAYEGEIAMVRSRPGNEVAKARMIEDFTKNAATAYSKILTRYPLMERAEDAKLRLAELHQPVPRPTRAAVAQNKAEEESRKETGTMAKVLRGFSKHPDVARASGVGEPTLVDPKPVNASDVIQEATRSMIGSSAAGNNQVSIEAIKGGQPAPNQPAPRSDAPAATGAPVAAADPAAPAAAPAEDPNELKPLADDPNELKPNVPAEDKPAAAPGQVNEIQNDSSSSSAQADHSKDNEEVEVSSSKRKKKKGLRKIVPF